MSSSSPKPPDSNSDYEESEAGEYMNVDVDMDANEDQSLQSSPFTFGTKRSLSPDEMGPDGIMTIPEAGRRVKKNRVFNPVQTPEQQQLLDIATAPLNQESIGGLRFDSFRECTNAFSMTRELFRKPLTECTDPATDETFPASDQQFKNLVARIFAAIMDWNSYIEWMQVVPKDIRECRSNELVAKIDQHEALRKSGAHVTDCALEVRDLIPTAAIREAHMTDVESQQVEVLGRACNGFTAECLAWKLVAAAMDAQQGWSGSTAWTTNDGA